MGAQFKLGSDGSEFDFNLAKWFERKHHNRYRSQRIHPDRFKRDVGALLRTGILDGEVQIDADGFHSKAGRGKPFRDFGLFIAQQRRVLQNARDVPGRAGDRWQSLENQPCLYRSQRVHRWCQLLHFITDKDDPAPSVQAPSIFSCPLEDGRHIHRPAVADMAAQLLVRPSFVQLRAGKDTPKRRNRLLSRVPRFDPASGRAVLSQCYNLRRNRQSSKSLALLSDDSQSQCLPRSDD